MATTLEPSIPVYLQQERSLPPKLPSSEWQPPFPSYSARFPEEIKDLTMAIIGVQHSEPNAGAECEQFERIRSFVETPLAKFHPCFWEAASVTDNHGCFNEVAIVYWSSAVDFDKWKSESGFEVWWDELKPDGQHGWFLESFLPSMDRLETVFSDDVVPEGAAHMRNGISGQIQEHGYWGSMRDRLPLSQIDDVIGERASPDEIATGKLQLDTYTRRIKVPGRRNLAVIRSGQDWSDTTPHERKKYLETMHPVLIFGRFLQYAGELQGNVTLRLFHEVMVLEPEQQVMEYIGCHSGTGMLASL
jgi:hypothetical protein